MPYPDSTLRLEIIAEQERVEALEKDLAPLKRSIAKLQDQLFVTTSQINKYNKSIERKRSILNKREAEMWDKLGDNNES